MGLSVALAHAPAVLPQGVWPNRCFRSVQVSGQVMNEELESAESAPGDGLVPGRVGQPRRRDAQRRQRKRQDQQAAHACAGPRSRDPALAGRRRAAAPAIRRRQAVPGALPCHREPAPRRRRCHACSGWRLVCRPPLLCRWLPAAWRRHRAAPAAAADGRRAKYSPSQPIAAAG